MIKGNTIVQIHFSPEFKKAFHEMFVKHNSLEEFPISKIIEHFLIKKTRIDIIIISNEQQNKLNKERILMQFT